MIGLKTIGMFCDFSMTRLYRLQTETRLKRALEAKNTVINMWRFEFGLIMQSNMKSSESQANFVFHVQQQQTDKTLKSGMERVVAQQVQ